MKETKQIERVLGNDQGPKKRMNGLERLPVHPVVPVLTTLLSERLASELCDILEVLRSAGRVFIAIVRYVGPKQPCQ